MKLLLVRHGETFANDAQRWSGSQDLEITNLTENGIEQAKKLATWFKTNNFIPTHIYVSPQKRALDTFHIAGDHWNIKPNIINELKETSAGNFEGHTWDEIEELFPQEADGFRFTRNWDVVTGAETELERRNRGVKILDIALNHTSKEDIVIMFCHASIIGNIVAAILETPKLWGIRTRNTAIFEFEIEPEKWNDTSREKNNLTLWRILRFNETPHLENEDKDLSLSLIHI